MAGLALVVFPATGVSLLLGQRLAEPAGVVPARMVGVALLTLGFSCWLGRDDSRSRAATGLVLARLFYDLSVVVILLMAYFYIRLLGIGLWPAVALPSCLGIWSFLCLSRARPSAVLV